MQTSLKLTPRLAKRLNLTPGLKQSLYVLQLPLIELREFLEAKTEENPFLEIAEQESAPPSFQNLPEYKEKDQPDFEFDEEKESYLKNLAAEVSGLDEYLLKQLHMLTLTPTEYNLGEFIIGSIDDDGYLRTSVEEIAGIQGAAIGEIEQLVSIIQSFEPVGVVARNLSECLLIQLKRQGKIDSLAARVVREHLEDVREKKFKAIASTLGVSEEKIQEAVAEIVKLEPKPGRAFAGTLAPRIIPEAMVDMDNKGFQVELAYDELPAVRINARYKKLLNDKNTASATREFLKKNLDAATWLVNAIKQRQATLKKIILAIVQFQRRAITQGMFWLRPLVLKEVAEATGLHVSTVSRAIANKYIHTPYGTFKLRDFFSGKIHSEKKAAVSTRSVKFQITELIRQENKKSPLTDEKIVSLLAKKGTTGISRRTIAKYRAQLKIPPSHLRK